MFFLVFDVIIQNVFQRQYNRLNIVITIKLHTACNNYNNFTCKMYQRFNCAEKSDLDKIMTREQKINIPFNLYSNIFFDKELNHLECSC